MGRQGHLVTITSAEENAFAINLANKSNFWIAATDIEFEGTWRWVAGPESGQIIGNFFWASNQPDNLGNEDYLGFSIVDNGWNDWTISGTGYSLVTLVEYECPVNPSPDGYCARKTRSLNHFTHKRS